MERTIERRKLTFILSWLSFLVSLPGIFHNGAFWVRKPLVFLFFRMTKMCHYEKWKVGRLKMASYSNWMLISIFLWSSPYFAGVLIDRISFLFFNIDPYQWHIPIHASIYENVLIISQQGPIQALVQGQVQVPIFWRPQGLVAKTF